MKNNVWVLGGLVVLGVLALVEAVVPGFSSIVKTTASGREIQCAGEIPEPITALLVAAGGVMMYCRNRRGPGR